MDSRIGAKVKEAQMDLSRVEYRGNDREGVPCEAGTYRPCMDVCGLVDEHDRRGPHPPTSREMAAKVAQIQYLDRDVDMPILIEI